MVSICIGHFELKILSELLHSRTKNLAGLVGGWVDVKTGLRIVQKFQQLATLDQTMHQLECNK